MGARYATNPGFEPQLQVNVYRKAADQGVPADTPATSAAVVNLLLGVTFSAVNNLQGSGFAQGPVYSHLAGYQRAQPWTDAAGVICGS